MALINERIAEIQQQLDVLTANSFEEVDALRIKGRDNRVVQPFSYGSKGGKSCYGPSAKCVASIG